MLAVGTGSGIFLFAERNGRWAQEGRAFEGVAVCDVAADRTSPGKAVAAARETGVFESSKGGYTWTQTADGFDPWSIDVGPDGTAYARTRPSAVYHRPPGESWRPLDLLTDQPSYGTWTFPTPPHLPNIRDIAFSPSKPGGIYGAVEVGGIIASRDGGATWANHREGLHLDVHTIVTAPGDEDVIYAATGRGFYRSFDAGRQWESACDGLASLYTVPLASHPAQPHRLVTSATNGRPRYWRQRATGAEAVIYRSDDGGSRWRSAMTGLPEQLTGEVTAFAVDPSDPDAFFATVLTGQVLAGRSFGDEWTVVADGLPPALAVAKVA
jgi:hypothetical protein